MKHIESVEIGGKLISFETGHLAKQADGSIVVRSGDSAVLVTAVVGETKPQFDFVPLTVDYQDRFGAHGAIPGGFMKREGRSTERETLVSRLIDRPLRPLLPKNFFYDTQVIATVMSYDKDNETDVLSVCGAAAAMYLSRAPMSAAMAAVRVCKLNGKFLINPGFADAEAAEVNLVVAGTQEAILMVEGGASQASETDMLDAFDVAHAAIKQIIGAIEALRAKVGQARIQLAPPAEPDAAIAATMAEKGLAGLVAAMATPGKHERKEAMNAVRDGIIAELLGGLSDDEKAERGEKIVGDAKKAWEKLIKKTMRKRVVETKVRLDGRAPDTIRAIECIVGLAPRAHGSALFTRGETQGFVTAALGVDEDAQLLDLPSGKRDRRFMLTYNFPPFCTGEARPMRGPKRREIGHGALAHRALERVMPAKEDFPYVVRVTSEILESNGSSSMATVCGGTLSMLDAGVPLKAPVAGIALGLVKEGDDFVVLSDILGDEDFLGDMDFKVTGTETGITAFQLDCKITGISREIMAQALDQARRGRLHILAEMGKTISAPRTELSKYAPRITTITIKPDKIREIIGPGGKTIRAIQEAANVRIKVEDSGRVDIASTDAECTARALQMIREITQEAELGALYVGVVKRITDFGAFVEIFPGTDGLIHISHLANDRVNKVTDVVSEGDEVLVRVIDIDRSGKIRLSRKDALGAMG